MRRELARICSVEIVHDRTVHLVFTDHSERNVDLTPLLWGPVFEEVRVNDIAFAALHVDPVLGTLAWPNGADLDPDVLHGDAPPVAFPDPAA